MVNNLHERAFRVVLNDQTRNFQTLLVKSSDICNYHRNNQTLMTEVFEIQNNLSHPIMEIILERKTNPCNLRNPQKFVT